MAIGSGLLGRTGWGGGGDRTHRGPDPGRWQSVRILLHADSGFCRDAPMTWAEDRRVDYVFGLARNARLAVEVAAEVQAARAEADATGKSGRRFKDYCWRTRASWSRERRAIGKAELTQNETTHASSSPRSPRPR